MSTGWLPKVTPLIRASGVPKFSARPWIRKFCSFNNKANLIEEDPQLIIRTLDMAYSLTGDFSISLLSSQ